MKNISLSIEADAMQAKVTCNGITKVWERTGNGSCKSSDKVNWEDHFSDELTEQLDDLPILDFMYECGLYKKPL